MTARAAAVERIGGRCDKEPDAYAAMVEFLVVGGYAVAGHGIRRATGDIDLWVRADAGNGAPRSRVSPESFTQPDVVYQICLPPNRIDCPQVASSKGGRSRS
jgi:hypothetical protein